MVCRQPEYNRAFRCLGGACPDTCCRDWEIVVDEGALADYRAAPAGLREALADALAPDGEGEVCFRLRPDGFCALLTPEGLCTIQRDWGEAHLCAHCAAYPRFTEEYGCLTETALAVSCPQAARLLMEAADFALKEGDDGGREPPFDGVEAELLAGLEATRARALALLGAREEPLWRRLAWLLAFADRCQDYVDFGLYGQLARCLPEPPQAEGAGSLRGLALDLLAACAALEPLRPAWPVLLRRRREELAGLDGEGYRRARRAFEAACPDWEGHLTNLACYLIFRHWHKTVNDDVLYGRAALVGGACVLLYHLCLLEWRERGALGPEREIALWSAFSREVEHMEENLSALAQGFYDLEKWEFLPALMAREP